MATSVKIVTENNVLAGRVRSVPVESEDPPAIDARYVGMFWRQPSTGILSMWISNDGNPTWVEV